MSDRMYYDPPSTAEQDDPRKALYARVGDLIIDTTKQRDVNPEKITRMGKWDWEKAEAPTIVERPDGTLAAVEGQNRIVKLQGIDPDIHLWVMVLPDADVDEARLSKDIATSRTPFNAFQKWRQDLRSHGELQVLANAVLEANEVSLSAKVRNVGGIREITAVGAVQRIMLLPETLQEGAELLDSVLTVLVSAFPSLPKKVWEGTLLKAVAGLIFRNGLKDENLARLASRLGAPGMTPELWLAESAHRKQGQSPLDAVTEAIAYSYNRNKREESRIR